MNDRETEEKKSDTGRGRRGSETKEVVEEEKEVRVREERDERGKVMVRREEVFEREREREREGKSGRKEGSKGGKSGGGGRV